RVSESPQPKWKEGWRTQPDVVVSMNQPYFIAARGTGEIKQFVIPNPFKEDTWVSSIEIRPGNPSVVHHVLLQVQDQTRPGVFKKVVTNCSDCTQKAVFTPADRPQVALAVQQFALSARADGFNAGPGPFDGQGSSYNDTFARLQERMTGRGAFTTM